MVTVMTIFYAKRLFIHAKSSKTLAVKVLRCNIIQYSLLSKMRYFPRI